MSDNRAWLQLPGDDHPRDWYGTAGAEDDIIGGRSIEELVGLDKDTWNVMAVTLLPGTRRGGEDSVLVYALDKADIPRVEGLHPNDELKRFADETGGVPVTKFHVSGVDIRDFFGNLKTAVIQLRPSGVRGVDFYVTGEGETAPEAQ